MSAEDATSESQEKKAAETGDGPAGKDTAGQGKASGAKGDAEGKTEAKPEEKAAKPKGRPWHRRPLLVGLLILGLIVLVVAGSLFWRHSRDHATSDDAYIDGISEQVAPQVAGRVTEVLVGDNQDVKAGQVVVKLDPSDYQSRLDQARAALAQAQAQMSEAQAQQAVYGAQAEEARANLGTAEANATNAANQLDRYRKLRAVNAGAVSAQQMDSATAAATSTAAQLNAAGKA